MDEETSAETAAASSKPVKELEKTELEYSTVKKVQSAKKGRQRFECLFRGGVDGSGTGGRKCGSFQGKPVKPKMKNRKDMTLDEVKAELIRRAKKEHDHERHVQNVEQQKAIAMEGQSTLDKYNTTPEMCDEVLAAASAGLPLNVTDNRHFRTCLAKVAACGTKFLRGYDDVHLSHSLSLSFSCFGAMAVQSTLDKYNTTPEMCDEAFAVAAASAGLPLNVTDNRHFRTCLAKVAACGTKFLRGYDDAHLSHSYTRRLWFKDGPLAGQAVVPWDLERERETFRSLVKAATDEEDDSN